MTNEVSKTDPIYIHKRINAIEMFRQKLYETDWAEIETSRKSKCELQNLFEKFFSLYGEYFPIKILKIKTKELQSPWIATAITKS